MVKLAKENAWKEFGERLNSDYLNAKKVFWQTIRRLRRKEDNKVRSVRSKTGRLLVEEQDVLNRWKEHFQELLNPVLAIENKIPSMAVGEDAAISVDEVALALRSLKSGKSTGICEIRP